jgi:hypothetical protein
LIDEVIERGKKGRKKEKGKRGSLLFFFFFVGGCNQVSLAPFVRPGFQTPILSSSHFSFFKSIFVSFFHFVTMRSSAFQKPLRTVWNVANHATESLWWPAAAQQEQQRTKTVLLFVCGNPGLVEYYTDFLNAIYEQAANPYLEIVGGKMLWLLLYYFI